MGVPLKELGRNISLFKKICYPNHFQGSLVSALTYKNATVGKLQHRSLFYDDNSLRLGSDRINNSKSKICEVLTNTQLKSVCLLPQLTNYGESKAVIRYYSTGSGGTVPELSKKEQLKRIFKDYGATGVIFHVTISLISLGGCYLAVSSGINLGQILPATGLGGSSEVAAEAGLFVVAYAVHKVLAPVRISITIAATPFIVRYLRKVNILKPPKPKQAKSE